MPFAVYETKCGHYRIEYEEDTVVHLKKIHEDCVGFGKKTKFTEYVVGQLSEYFDGSRKMFDFKYELRGTEFQKKVWNALLQIPYGETRTYKDIAIAVGNEKACRAVGLANNKNPISIAVPCHRVIGVNGKLVGYAGGLEIKEYLLKMESENV